MAVEVVSCLCRFLRFVTAQEKSGPRDFAAEAEVQLTQEQIQECGQQFGVELETKHDLLSMKKTMLRDTYRDWVNACGHLQIMENALAKGVYEDRKDGLWKQAVVRRYMTYRLVLCCTSNIAADDTSCLHNDACCAFCGLTLHITTCGFCKVM